MQDVFKVQCTDCLHSDERQLYAKIYKFMREHGLIPDGIFPPSKHANAMESETISTRGLCLSCLKRNSCPLSETLGGIWHCKNYK